jgi:hypothetical protein
MKHRIAKKILLAAAILLAAVSSQRAQQNATGRANDFTSVEYFEPPNQKQMKSRLSGANAQPEAGGVLIIRQLKLELFNTDGSVKIIARAPRCVYDMMNGVANSPGKLQLQSGDGKLRVEGDGFLWRQNDSWLTLSNNVRTEIEAEPGARTAL